MANRIKEVNQIELQLGYSSHARKKKSSGLASWTWDRENVAPCAPSYAEMAGSLREHLLEISQARFILHSSKNSGHWWSLCDSPGLAWTHPVGTENFPAVVLKFYFSELSVEIFFKKLLIPVAYPRMSETESLVVCILKKYCESFWCIAKLNTSEFRQIERIRFPTRN